MTQPIGEPLIQRSISQLNWDKNQLQRRPGFVPDEEESECQTSLVYHLISAVGDNEHVIAGFPVLLTGYYVCNIAATYRYVKLYDTTSTPVLGTTAVAITLGIPPLTAANIGFESFPEFYDGIGIATSTDIADTGSTGLPAIQELAINIYYCDNPNPSS